MMKILLIGSNGNMGKNHYRILKKLLQTTEHKLITCDWSGNTDYNDYIQAVEIESPNIVLIASPTETHEEILDFCLKHKFIKKIFVEKPISMKSPEKYLNKRIFVGHIERYNPVVRTIKKQLGNKKIYNITCLRSGLTTPGEDFNVDLDLCIHDFDAATYLTKQDKPTHYSNKIAKFIEANMADIMCRINDVTCFFHADKKSPIKRRTISVLAEDTYIEADYINQSLTVNGRNVTVHKEEPLQNELKTFLFEELDTRALEDAINAVRCLNG